MRKNKVKYSELIPRTSEWPIYRLSRNRDAFIKEVIADSVDNFQSLRKGRSLREELETTVYREKLRMKANPWRVDPKDEKEFWVEMQRRLLESEGDPQAEDEEQRILHDIIARYAHEIAGNFRKSYYKFARTFVTFGFARLLNAARVNGFLSLFSKQLDLDDKIRIVGETEHLRNLATKGTVVMVPTHFSNLDSILIGWVIQFLGLPAFIYGAGLNLFNIKIFAYFMNSLGAYKVDRRKKNPVYLQTLRSYSTLAIGRGCHSLFFPGGTRSRSGQIEQNLKLGLLGTAVEAQRKIYQDNADDKTKVFIVPVVINYQFTLEAPALIREHLKRTGQERFYEESDEFSTSYKIASFLFKFFTKGSDISVTIGKGMDILGNYVDNEGHSYDKNGTWIHPRDYFVSHGEITIDTQREQTYVRILSKRIVEEYHLNNRVFSSHLVAFAAFKILERRNPKLDLYHVLRLPDEDLTIDFEEFKRVFKKLRKQIVKLEKKGKVGTAPKLKESAENAIAEGLRNVGMYHAKRPLIRKKDKIVIQDANTLFYYHNRMEGYGLERHI
ncbi:MAG: 1-acyl-sn-glycerol-3-phosphate acyltransferase [Bacteroidota bacterium]